MPAVNFTPDDLAPFADIADDKASAMIEDAVATAARVAPCILTDDFAYGAAAKAILRAAVLRWNDAGSGAYASQTAGPFGQTIDTRVQRKGMFWPSEIEQLQKLCQDPNAASGAFAIDTLGTPAIAHAETCSINFGATYCSCGAILTQGLPLYEAGY